jgi:hypothetical protein
MTPERRLAIEWERSKLIHCYALLNDERRWEEVAALYTADAVRRRLTRPQLHKGWFS